MEEEISESSSRKNDYYQEYYYQQRRNQKFKKNEHKNIEVEITSIEQTQPTNYENLRRKREIENNYSYSYYKTTNSKTKKVNKKENKLKNKKENIDKNNNSEKNDSSVNENTTMASTNNVNSINNNIASDTKEDTKNKNNEKIISQLKNLISSLEGLEINKKIANIDTKMSEIETMVENKIKEFSNKSEKQMNVIQNLFQWETQQEIKEKVEKSKGENYSKSFLIRNVYDFQKYYENILSNDLKELIYNHSSMKIISNLKSVSEIIHLIFNEENKEKSESLIEINDKIYSEDGDNDEEEFDINEEFWLLIKNLSKQWKKEKDDDDERFNEIIDRSWKINISGSIYRLIKHHRGVNDDIIIDLGDVMPYINDEKELENSKKKIFILSLVLSKILIKQLEQIGIIPANEKENGIKLYSYGHIFYGMKINSNIELKDYETNEIYFDFIQV